MEMIVALTMGAPRKNEDSIAASIDCSMAEGMSFLVMEMRMEVAIRVQVSVVQRREVIVYVGGPQILMVYCRGVVFLFLMGREKVSRLGLDAIGIGRQT